MDDYDWEIEDIERRREINRKNAAYAKEHAAWISKKTKRLEVLNKKISELAAEREKLKAEPFVQQGPKRKPKNRRL